MAEIPFLYNAQLLTPPVPLIQNHVLYTVNAPLIWLKIIKKYNSLRHVLCLSNSRLNRREQGGYIMPKNFMKDGSGCPKMDA